jgi:Family of unknown function (DUF6687)
MGDLPRIAPTARFVAFDRVTGPCCVVDGPRLPGAALALSHWPASGTPEALAADTSAEIAVRYLEADARGPEVDALTNNHFDEDGLFALWLLLERPEPDDPRRALAVAAAEAGDFRTWTDPGAARCALAAMAMAERGTTPFPAVQRALAPGATRDPAGAIYDALLPRVGRLLADPDRYRLLWAPAWERVERDLALLEAGGARVDEVAEADLAIVRAPRPLARMAVYPRTACTRVLSATEDGRLVLEHRYETWVDYRSRPLAPRVDLAPLVPRLQAAERRPGTWRADEMAAMTPRLLLAGADGAPAPSSLGADALARMLADHLAAA